MLGTASGLTRIGVAAIDSSGARSLLDKAVVLEHVDEACASSWRHSFVCIARTSAKQVA